MTKFCLVSDLHLGFGSVDIINSENADCLILAGDIYEFHSLQSKNQFMNNRVDDFFATISEQFTQVVYVAGNHEYYGFCIDNGKEHINEYLESMNIGNIKFLEKESIEIGDVLIHGATLWTNFNNGDSNAMHQAKCGMNDYRYISKDSDTILTPKIAFDDHVKSMQYFSDSLDDTKKNIIVSHHAPHYDCISPEHSHEDLQHAYASDLTEFITANPCIAAWCFGHVHERHDFMIGSTRILANCRGYNKYEEMANTFKPFFFDV